MTKDQYSLTYKLFHTQKINFWPLYKQILQRNLISCPTQVKYTFTNLLFSLLWNIAQQYSLNIVTLIKLKLFKDAKPNCVK